MQKQNDERIKPVETMKVAIEAVRHAQMCMFKVENATRVDFLKWNCETYNVLDLLEAWVKAMED